MTDLNTIHTARHAAGATMSGSGIRLWTVMAPEPVVFELLREARGAGAAGSTPLETVGNALDMVVRPTVYGSVVLLCHNERGALLGAFPVAPMSDPIGRKHD